LSKANSHSESFVTEQLLSDLYERITLVLPEYAGLVSPTTVRSELDWNLCHQGSIAEADLLFAYMEATRITEVEETEIVDIQAYEHLSSMFLNKWGCVPIQWEDSQVEILICDPYHIDNIVYYFDKFYHAGVSFKFARRSLIERLVQSVYDVGEPEEEFDDNYESDGSEESLKSMASEAKIVRLVNEMFSRAADMNASDIHVEPERDRLAVRFRVDGILHEVITVPLNQYPAISSRIKLVGGLNIAESRLPQDGRVNLKFGKIELDIRVNTIPTMTGESIVMRLLRKDAMDLDLGHLGMDFDMKDSFDKMIQAPHGIILVVGPTGSGKTTTLYSIVSQLNTEDKKIVTIEDPVEYQLDRLSQIQVNPSIGLTFADGLRNIVRQDPDIILVGEIRDKETAEIAINAALTGHLVFSTLHTNDAAGTISRLLDMGVEGFLLSSALGGVLSQRLVRKSCTVCHGEGVYAVNSKCKNCNGTGFKGRTGIYELMDIDDEIREAIAGNADSSRITQIALKNGMKTLAEDGARKVSEGVTTEVEVSRVASTASLEV